MLRLALPGPGRLRRRTQPLRGPRPARPYFHSSFTTHNDTPHTTTISPLVSSSSLSLWRWGLSEKYIVLQEIGSREPLQTERYLMPSTTIQWFKYEHLPVKLQEVSKPIAELAQLMEETLPDGAEKSAGMRKLLEAKDCFVRAKLEAK
jgi:hypothetical protein